MESKKGVNNYTSGETIKHVYIEKYYAICDPRRKSLGPVLKNQLFLPSVRLP